MRTDKLFPLSDEGKNSLLVSNSSGTSSQLQQLIDNGAAILIFIMLVTFAEISKLDGSGFLKS